MSTQIAVRLPDDLVDYVDSVVRDGVGSRAEVVKRALHLYRQQQQGERDARILETSGDYDDFDELTGHPLVED